MEYLNRLTSFIADLVWPPRCAVCGHLGSVACSPCLKRLVAFLPLRCPACQRPSRAGLPCFVCRGRTSVDRLLSATPFNEHAGAFIHALKYLNIQSLANVLTDRCCDVVSLRPDTATMFGTNPLIVPVPLHASRLRERGYNQAELIARRIAGITAMPIQTDILMRTRATGQQVKTASRAQRRDNMQGAFVVADTTRVVDCDIVLVDDVCTTGATLEDCARALKEAGARSVSAFTLAHG